MIQRNAIKLQKEKNSQYQELLADQLGKNANLQMSLDAFKERSNKKCKVKLYKSYQSELEEAKKEIEEMREKTQKVLEYKEMLEVNQLKAEAEQQMIKQIKEYSSKEQQTTPNETVFSKSILERDVKTNPKRDGTSSPNSNLD